MKKALSFIVLICMLLAIYPLTVSAEQQIETDKISSLTLQYRHGEEVFPDLMVYTYRVAQISSAGDYILTGDFKQYPINIDGIQSQSEWRRIATTFAAYIAADHLAFTKSQKTNEEGKVCFENLLPGLYLTLSVRAEKDGILTIFETFFTSIPYPGEDGNYLYDVLAYPKCERHQIQPEERSYQVVKQWKDGSYSHLRPETVTVDILKDGVWQSSQILSSENNWSYSWNALDDGSKWQVVERDIPERYTVSVEEFDLMIVITNIYEHSDKPPQTGDVSMPHLYLLIISLLGIILILVAVWRKRAGI